MSDFTHFLGKTLLDVAVGAVIGALVGYGTTLLLPILAPGLAATFGLGANLVENVATFLPESMALFFAVANALTSVATDSLAFGKEEMQQWRRRAAHATALSPASAIAPKSAGIAALAETPIVTRSLALPDATVHSGQIQGALARPAQAIGIP